MNEYQESLVILKKLEEEHNKKVIGISNSPVADVLQELVDTTKTPTFEEIKQDWKNLEYELIVAKSRELVFRRKTDGTIFTIQSLGITYYSKCWRGKNINITIKEHQLLTKTFRALGWEV